MRLGKVVVRDPAAKPAAKAAALTVRVSCVFVREADDSDRSTTVRPRLSTAPLGLCVKRPEPPTIEKPRAVPGVVGSQ